MATLLTAHGVRLLFQDSSPEAALHLQVLGVYRCTCRICPEVIGRRWPIA
jgi:hypothetical protein